MALRYVQAQKFKLAGSGITSVDTTIILTSMTLPDGTTKIVTADLGEICYATLEPGTSKEEMISFTSITQNVGGTATLGGVTRGLRFVNPHDEVAGNKKSHAGGTIMIISNTSGLYNKIVDYINGVSIAGAADASTTVKGIVEEATDAEITAGSSTGGTGARLFINPSSLKSSGLFKFGGDGSDGALTVTSGNTAIDLGSAQVVIKNYSSISITGTGSISFTNHHANGTHIILKSKGDVTLTSSTAPMIDASGMGANGGAATTIGASTSGTGNNGTDGKSYGIIPTTNKGLIATGTAGTAATLAYPSAFIDKLWGKYPHAFIGAGGASGDVATGIGGSATSGKGGDGGPTLIIECFGALNFTTAGGISVAGKNGGAVSNSASNYKVMGGGGGAGGLCIVLYNTLTAASGTITVSGGTGSTGAANGSSTGGTFYSGGGGANYAAGTAGSTTATNPAGNGATGLSLVAKNTEFA